MATIKTAVSLQEALFTQVENLARDLRVSRSELVALALEEYLRRYQNQQLLNAINQAYDAQPDIDEVSGNTAQRQHHRRIVVG